MLGEIPESRKEDTQLATAGSYDQSRLRSRTRRGRPVDQSLELTNLDQAHTVTEAAQGDDHNSMASDSSRRAIVVRQTIDVQYEPEVLHQA